MGDGRLFHLVPGVAACGGARIMCLMLPSLQSLLLGATESAQPVEQALRPAAEAAPSPIMLVVGVGCVLIVLGILFAIRKFLYLLINVFFVLFGAVLVLIALLGNDIGLYQAIGDWLGGDNPGKGQGDGSGDQHGVEHVEETPEAR